MIPVAFEYTRPSTVEDAVAALAADPDAKVLAGGQSLLPVLRLRLAAPSTLVDLRDVESLHGVRVADGELVIGAMTTHAEILHDRRVAEHAPLIAAATATVGDRQVRHLGTFGGSLSHADPAGDLPAVALALSATMVAVGPGGRREIPAADFFVDYLTTALAPDEILAEVRVPDTAGWGYRYEKFSRMAQAWAVVAVAALVRRSDGGVADTRVALTSMASRPVRATAVEQALTGTDGDSGAITAAAGHADEGTQPPDDVNGAADYRAHLARVLTRRALTAAAGA
jgi:carbon-monoxide dehydrogenase medium subunit